MFKKIFILSFIFLRYFELSVAQNGKAAFQSGIDGFVSKINTIFLEPILTILIAISTVYFVWGIVVFLSNTEGTKKDEGKQHMLWGIIGLFIIFTVWGFMNIIMDTINSVR